MKSKLGAENKPTVHEKLNDLFFSFYICFRVILCFGHDTEHNFERKRDSYRHCLPRAGNKKYVSIWSEISLVKY